MRRAIGRRQALTGFGLAAASLAAAACGRPAANTALNKPAVKPASGGPTSAAPSDEPAVSDRPAGTLLWRTGRAYGSLPAVLTADSRVYISGPGRVRGNTGLYALDAATGRKLWRTPGNSGPYPWTTGPGAVFGFMATPDGRIEVVATSAATGRALWTKNVGSLLDSAQDGAMCYASGLVYVGGGATAHSTEGQPTVRALDARTGAQMWEARLGAAPQTPAVVDGVVYVGAADSIPATSGTVAALDAATGRHLWQSVDLGGWPGGYMVVDGVLWGGSSPPRGPGALFGLDARTGRRLWHMTSFFATAVSTGGIVLCVFEDFGSGPSTYSGQRYIVEARHARTGALAWKRAFPGESSMAAARGVLYLSTGPGKLHALRAATGEPLWSRRLGDQVSEFDIDAVAIYLTDDSGAVYAFRT